MLNSVVAGGEEIIHNYYANKISLPFVHFRFLLFLVAWPTLKNWLKPMSRPALSNGNGNSNSQKVTQLRAVNFEINTHDSYQWHGNNFGKRAKSNQVTTCFYFILLLRVF